MSDEIKRNPTFSGVDKYLQYITKLYDRQVQILAGPSTSVCTMPKSMPRVSITPSAFWLAPARNYARSPPSEVLPQALR
jgi:hypothetical protein